MNGETATNGTAVRGRGWGWVRRPEGIVALLAAGLATAYPLLPRMGSDLAAQVARSAFFATHGFTPIDLRWYGGVNQFGYSLVAQPVMAVLGVRVTGAVSLVAAAVAFAVLLRRTGAPRPLLGAVVGTVCIAGNLASGRVTYGLGVAFGLAALLGLTARDQRVRLGVAAAAGLLASATSPVAGLFLGLAGVALVAARRFVDGAVLAVAAAIPLTLTAGLFGDGGWMNISRTDATRAVVVSLVVAAVVSLRPVRWGALLSAGGVLVAALVHTPVGLNATRLSVMFALPVLAAWASVPRRGPAASVLRRGPAAQWWDRRGVGAAALAALLALGCLWQPPVLLRDVRAIGDPTADPAYFSSLRDRLASAPLTGRVEIPPTANYWEAAHLGTVPLARGWLRQADIDRNPLFFTTVPGAAGTGVALTAQSYRAWLAEQAVQYVAVPAAELSWVGRAEARLVAGGLPYLTLVWSDQRWRLYAVTDAVPLVAAPATLVGQTAAALTLDAPVAGDVPVRVRYSRWLTATGGATVSRAGDWTVLRLPRPGRYTLTS
jgi:hypothetical protein